MGAPWSWRIGSRAGGCVSDRFGEGPRIHPLQASVLSSGNWESCVGNHLAMTSELASGVPSPSVKHCRVGMQGWPRPPRMLTRVVRHSHFPTYLRALLVAQMVKDLPAVWDTWFQSLCWEDPLEEGMATHSSILTWRIFMDRGA